MSKKEKDCWISRDVLEIRFENKNLHFVDFKGELADFIINKTELNKFKMYANRVDISNDNNSKIYFFSWDNLGLQLEGSETKDVFSKQSKKILSLLKEFDKYKPNRISRIGTKSTVLFHPQNKNIEELRKKVTKIFFNQQHLLEKNGIKIIDNGIYALEIEYSIFKAKISIGIMTKKESIEKIFQNEIYEKNFSPNCGIYIDIDIYDQDKKFTEYDTTSNSIEKQIYSSRNIISTIIDTLSDKE